MSQNLAVLFVVVVALAYVKPVYGAWAVPCGETECDNLWPEPCGAKILKAVAMLPFNDIDINFQFQ
ncbi:hypothetical protein [Solidesulfovibrio magneticus]|uniref:hypothetical protein n=1 Tax=Solidesulfovibrio magneticus TaxID=184917 RepID=UPI0005B8EE3D|nr:hypothetical protein [Solidesulfovibrio magneticus]